MPAKPDTLTDDRNANTKVISNHCTQIPEKFLKEDDLTTHMVLAVKTESIKK
jgi:hypothetical protein